MTSPKAGGWIAGTAFVGVIIVALAWFLAISPELDSASATRDQVTSQQSQNEQTRVKIAVLKTQFAKLDELKAQLAAVRLQVPTSDDLANYQNQLAGIAALHQVTVVSAQFAAPAPVVPLVAASPSPSASAGATGSATGATGTAAAAATPAAKTATPGFYAVAVNLDVIGSFSNATAFLNDLQSGTQRLLLVNGLTATSLKKADAAGGRPATVDGDLDLVISGDLYVLTDDTAKAASTPSTTATTPPALPVPDPAKNPFKPLG